MVIMIIHAPHTTTESWCSFSDHRRGRNDSQPKYQPKPNNPRDDGHGCRIFPHISFMRNPSWDSIIVSAIEIRFRHRHSHRLCCYLLLALKSGFHYPLPQRPPASQPASVGTLFVVGQICALAYNLWGESGSKFGHGVMYPPHFVVHAVIDYLRDLLFTPLRYSSCEYSQDFSRYSSEDSFMNFKGFLQKLLHGIL